MSSSSSPMMENNQIGRYGTMSLLKQNESDVVIASFGIDSDNLTFGKDQSCGVRLYYPDVSPIHAKITFQERKAFLVVLGTQGLLVDGCKVFASSATSSPNIIPLANNSEIEIHGKRFKFTYPPKELRAQLMSTPTLAKRRTPRLSMIQSAEVFSPRPSPNPMENLRVLQSPLKLYHIRSRSSTPTPSPSRPLFPSTIDHTKEDEDKIILVEGNCPRVVEEEKDLIILEDVETPTVVEPNPFARMSPSKSPTKSQYVPAPPPILLSAQPPVTPRKSRPTLHKAVLIRSVQRAVMQAELQREEEMEEEEEEEAEVLGTIVAESDEEDEEEDHEQDAAVEAQSTEPHEQALQPIWKASLERIWPFRRSTSPTKNLPKEEEDMDTLVADEALMEIDDNDDALEAEELKEENEILAPLYPRLDASLAGNPARQPFSTPQPQRQTISQPRFSLGPSFDPQRSRMSMGGGEPRRIKVEEQPWKVQDLVVPPPPSSPTKTSTTPGNYERTPAANQLSEDERRAIQERRRSAASMPDNFFPGTPGFGPSSPVKNATQTPMRVGRQSIAVADDQLDTRSLLEKMKETVEGMKAQRALMTSPQKRVFTEATTPVVTDEQFSLLRSPVKRAPRLSSVFDSEEPQSLPVRGSIITPPESVISSESGSAIQDDVETVDAAPSDIPSSLPEPHTIRKKVSKEKLVDTPSLADDEASPDVIGKITEPESDDERINRKPTRVLRGTGKASYSSRKKPPSKTRPASKPPSTSALYGASTAIEMVVEASATPIEDESPPEAVPLLKPTARGRSRSRSKTPNPQSSTALEEESNKGDTKSTRRIAHKASAEPATRQATTEDEASAPTTQRTRKTLASGSRARGKVTEESDTDTAVVKKPPSRTTRSRAKTPVSEVETDEESLRSVDEEVMITKTKRGRRPKAAVVPEPIKEEEVDESSLPAKKAACRSKKTAPASSDNIPLPLPATTGVKGRSKKTVVPEPEAYVNKENAHASASEDEPVVTKTKIGRPRKAAVMVKEEPSTEPETGLRASARTRAMRTRSKT